MSDSSLPQSEIILYQTADGRTRIQCRFENETLWLTQAQIAELFQTTPQNVTLHLKAIYAEGELTEETTCKDYLQVRDEGARQVSRKLRHYLEFPRFRGQLAWRDSASGGAQEGGGTPQGQAPRRLDPGALVRTQDQQPR